MPLSPRLAVPQVLTLAILSVGLLSVSQGSDEGRRQPGPLGRGVTLLPNGWRIAPAGRHLDAGDLPLAMALHPDGRHLVITNNGWSVPSLRVTATEIYAIFTQQDYPHPFHSGP